MMTVVMIGHKGLPTRSGGIERHVEELSTELACLGVRVISFDRKWYVRDADPVPGILRRWSYGFRTKHLDAITHTLTAILLARRERPDIVHIHGVGPSLLIPLARLVMPRTRIISTFHCMDRAHKKWNRFARTMLRLGEWIACRFAHRTITVSESLASYCLKAYQAQTVVIPNGVRQTREPSSDVISALGLKPNGYFAMVARLIPHKNIHVAIEAHAMLAKRRPDLASSHPLVIVGGGAFTDEYASELRKMASDYPHVFLAGELYGETLNAIQAHALAHLSVSSSEGMSIALLEAMSMRRPLIVSDISENVEVTEHDALVVRVNDASSLSCAMETVLDMTDRERECMGDSLYRRIAVFHDWKNIAEQTRAVYAEALGSPIPDMTDHLSVTESHPVFSSIGGRGL